MSIGRAGRHAESCSGFRDWWTSARWRNARQLDFGRSQGARSLLPLFTHVRRCSSMLSKVFAVLRNSEMTTRPARLRMAGCFLATRSNRRLTRSKRELSLVISPARRTLLAPALCPSQLVRGDRTSHSGIAMRRRTNPACPTRMLSQLERGESSVSLGLTRREGRTHGAGTGERLTQVTALAKRSEVAT